MGEGSRITDWAEREPELFVGRRATDGDGRPGDRRRGERRRGERRSATSDAGWAAMGLPDRRTDVS